MLFRVKHPLAIYMDTLSLLPREAFRYWPTGDQAVSGSGRFSQRKIYHRQTFRPEEEAAVQTLLNRLKPTQMTANPPKADLLRVIYAAGWDLDQAAKALEALLVWPKWVHSHPLEGSVVATILDSGGLYFHGRDCYYRPLVVLVPFVLLQLPYSLEDIMRAAAHFFLFLELKMLLPGQIEAWVLLLDLAGASACPTIVVISP